MPPMPRRNDVEVIYPSTRRSRSGTHGLNGPLSCILEAGSNPRASGDDVRPVSEGFSELASNPIDATKYRGINRTSMSFY
jgi:hypothetical protein